MNPLSDKIKAEYLVHHGGQVQGPFDLNFVEAMVMAGVYPADVRVQVVGESKIAPLNQRRGEALLPPAPQQHEIEIEVIPGLFGEEVLFPPAQKQAEPPRLTSRQERRGRPLPVQNHSEPPPSPPKPLSTEAKFAWGVGIAGTLVLLLIFAVVSSSSSSRSDISYPSTTAPDGLNHAQHRALDAARAASDAVRAAIAESVYSPTPPPPSYTPSASTYSPSFGSSSSIAPPKEDSQIYRDASGRTYRVPNSAYYRLLTMKSALDAKQRLLDAEEAQLKSLADELDRERLYLNRSSQYSVDAFNRKVNRVNSLNDRLQSSVNDYNRDVNAFNAELERVGTLIR